MYSFHNSLIHFSSTITLPDTPFRQFDPVISCLSFTIYFASRKISFWCSGSFRSLAHSFCFFSFAEEITLFALCLHFLYFNHASFKFSLFPFLYFIFFSLIASATSSFHHHVSLCLQGPFDIPHMRCAVSIIIFFILCQCSFTSRCFHSSCSTLSLTMLLYSSQVCSSLTFHTRTLGLNFLCRLFTGSIARSTTRRY